MTQEKYIRVSRIRNIMDIDRRVIENLAADGKPVALNLAAEGYRVCAMLLDEHIDALRWINEMRDKAWEIKAEKEKA